MMQSFEVNFVLGDVVVAGKDRLFENLFDEEIAALVVKSQKEDRHKRMAKMIARVLANAAVASGSDRTRNTPFAADCARVGIQHSGGKVDDVTVIVMKVRLFVCLIFFSSLGICLLFSHPKKSWLLTSSFLSQFIFLSLMPTSALQDSASMTKPVEVRQLIKVERIVLI